MRALIVITALLCAGAGLYSQQISLWDYKPPISQESTMYLNFEYNYDDTYNPIRDKGNFDFNYFRFYSSLPFEWSFNLSSNNSYNYSSNVVNHQYMYFQNDNGNIKTNTDISFNIRKFFSEESNYFINGSISPEIASLKYFDSLNLYVPINIGIGYGRFYSASNFAKALRADEFLNSEEITSGNMNKETLINLAEHLDKRTEYNYKYGEKSDAEWWKDLEMILLNSGKINGGRLTPYSLFRLNKAFSERYYSRMIGWNISANLQTLFEHTFDSRDYYKTLIGFNLAFNMGYSISNSLHLNQSSYYTYNLEYLNVGSSKNVEASHDVYNSTKLSYELTTLIDFLISYTFNSNKANFMYGWNSLLYINHNLGMELYYYIENNISIGLSSSIDFQKRFVGDKKILDKTIRKINLSLYYRFF